MFPQKGFLMENLQTRSIPLIDSIPQLCSLIFNIKQFNKPEYQLKYEKIS